MNLAYSQRNRSAACRIPMYSPSPKSKRVEFRCPDPSCNPYLAFSAMLMAVIDGIQNKIDPGEPLDKDIYDLSRSGRSGGTFRRRRLARGGAGGAARRPRVPAPRRRLHPEDVIDTWIWYKTENEVDQLRLRPHPYEFCMYADI